MPRMPNNEDGHVLNGTLIVYNAAEWSDEGRREFAKWLREKAKFIVKEGANFGPRAAMKRWSVDETPAPVPAPQPVAKKRNPNRLDLKATPSVAKEGRVKVPPRKSKQALKARAREIMEERPKVQLKSTPRSKFAVAPYASGQRLRVKRAGG
jgi:hypothetical protein